MRYVICMVWWSLGTPALAQQQDVRLDPCCAVIFQENPHLMEGGVDVVNMAGLGEVVVGVGVTMHAAGSPSDPRAWLEMRMVGESKASRAVALWFDAAVETESALVRERYTEVTSTPSGTERLERVKKWLKTTTRESASVLLRKTKTIGTWKSEDGALFYTAIMVQGVQ